jgi:arylsulfatase A-like enzyme/Flp pilus assembly protein TadD
LLISIDTLRADHIGCYSNKLASTPNINSYCLNGIQFLKAFAHNPVTLPSHINILTGTTPVFHNIHDNIGFRLNISNITIAEQLKKFGYKTAAFVGAFPLDSRFGLDKGFDIYDDNYGEKSSPGVFYFTERPANKVIEKTLNWLKNNKNDKWFIFLHLFDPHQPYIPPPPFNNIFKDNLYDGEIAFVDHSLASLFNYLKLNNLENNTLIIITSDHGEGLGEHGENTHGYFAYNSTLHIPLILYNPIIFKKHLKINTFVSHIDIFPTICDILNIPKPKHLQGKSLIDIIFKNQTETHPIYFESLSAYYNRNWAPIRGFIYNNLKFIDSPLPELYNLSIDFNELHNIYDSTKHKNLKAQLNDIINKYSNKSLKENRTFADKESIEVLKSLGYVGTTDIRPKKAFTASDDLKTLLPLHQALMDSLKLFDEGKTEDAINKLKDVVSKRKDFSTAFAFLANLLHETGNIQEAISILKTGSKFSPQSYELHSKLGIYYVEFGQPDKAIDELKKAIEIVNFDPETYNYLGIAYWKMGNFNQAEKAYFKAIELDSNYAGALNNLGSLYLSTKQITLAEQYFKKALQYDPELASAYNGLGIVQQTKGNKSEAIKYWQKALEKEPNHLLALYNLAYALATSENKKEALPYLKKYLQIAPTSDPDREKVMWLIEAIEK